MKKYASPCPLVEGDNTKRCCLINIPLKEGVAEGRGRSPFSPAEDQVRSFWSFFAYQAPEFLFPPCPYASHNAIL